MRGAVAALWGLLAVAGATAEVGQCPRGPAAAPVDPPEEDTIELLQASRVSSLSWPQRTQRAGAVSEKTEAAPLGSALAVKVGHPAINAGDERAASARALAAAPAVVHGAGGAKIGASAPRAHASLLDLALAQEGVPQYSDIFAARVAAPESEFQHLVEAAGVPSSRVLASEPAAAPSDEDALLLGRAQLSELRERIALLQAAPKPEPAPAPAPAPAAAASPTPPPSAATAAVPAVPEGKSDAGELLNIGDSVAAFGTALFATMLCGFFYCMYNVNSTYAGIRDQKHGDPVSMEELKLKIEEQTRAYWSTIWSLVFVFLLGCTGFGIFWSMGVLQPFLDQALFFLYFLILAVVAVGTMVFHAWSDLTFAEYKTRDAVQYSMSRMENMSLAGDARGTMPPEPDSGWRSMWAPFRSQKSVNFDQGYMPEETSNNSPAGQEQPPQFSDQTGAAGSGRYYQ